MTTMKRLLLINCRPDERRVALIENGLTTELFFERFKERTLVGNIYKGRVVRVLPGMQSAFVEVGLSRTGFLFVGDYVRPDKPVGVDEGGGGPTPDGDEDVSEAAAGRGEKYPPIAEVLKVGQEILVQVAKEPIGTKGARLTAHISLPGRHVVYLPTVEHLGISRRIGDADERARLKEIAERIAPDSGGLILRTVAEGQGEEDLREDLTFLRRLWDDVRTRAEKLRAPELVHEDLDVTLRSVRDLLTSEDDRVLVDSEDEAERVRQFVARFMPQFEQSVETWSGPDTLFERFGLEWEISRAMRRRVWLKSGGYIIIDRTEALTAIDVNSGRNVGKANFEQTIFEVNLEAVREIAYQLRFRDIGGIIVIDFIDMESPDNRERVHEALVEALSADKATTKVLPMSQLGLIEMTRKRVRESIVSTLTEPCMYCDGQGYLKAAWVVVDELMRRVRQQLTREPQQQLSIHAHPKVTELLIEEYQDELTDLEREHKAEIRVVPREDLHVENVEIR